MRRLVMLSLAVMLMALGVTHAGPARGGAVIICSVIVEWCNLLKREFPKATGISLDFVRLSTGEALARLRAEQANPLFDAWFGGTGDPHFAAAELGVTEFYKPKVWDDLRLELREAVAGKYIPLYVGILGWAVNTTRLKEAGSPEPQTWHDLADPRYKGLVAYPNPSTSGTGYTMLATMVQIYGEDNAFEILKRVHRNIAEYTRSGAAPSILAGRGEVAIGVVFIEVVIEQILRGFPLKYGSARNGTGFEIGGLSLVKGAPNRVNAIAFVEWALSPEAQRLPAEVDIHQNASNIKTPITRMTPRFQDFGVIKYDFLKFGRPDVRDRLVKRWTTEVSPLPK